MLYTAVFVFILINSFFTSHIKGSASKKQKWFCISCWLVLALMSACRYEIGATSDIYRNYMHVYRFARIPWAEVFSISSEPLHQVLRKVIATVFGDPQAYFFVTAFFIVGVTLFQINKYSNNIYLGVVLYYVWGGYFGANNTTRQYIAIVISLLAVQYIIKDKPFLYALSILAAIGFHTSAIVVVPLYFLCRKKFNRNVLLVYAVSAIGLVVLNRPVVRLMQRFLYSDYGAGYGANSSNVIRLVWPLFVFICLILIRNSNYQCVPVCLENQSRSTELFNNLISHGAILNIYFSLLSAVNMLMFSRVASYFTFYSMLSLLYGVKAPANTNNRRVLTAALWLLAISWFVVMNRSGKYIPTPYTPFWEYPWRAIIQ